MKDIIEKMLNKPLRSILLIDTLTFAVVRVISAVKGTKVDPIVYINLGCKANKEPE